MAALREAFLRHIDDLRNWCAIQSGDPDLAHDVAQDTALVALERMGSLRDPRSLRTWLWRIAQRRLTEAARARTFLPLVAEPPAPAPEPRFEPEERRRLERAVARLPAGLRQPVRLHYLHGHPLREVAALLAITRNAVKTRLYRARILMRKEVQSCSRR